MNQITICYAYEDVKYIIKTYFKDLDFTTLFAKSDVQCFGLQQDGKVKIMSPNIRVILAYLLGLSEGKFPEAASYLRMRCEQYFEEI